MAKRVWYSFSALALLGGGVVVGIVFRDSLREWYYQRTQGDVPTAITYNDLNNSADTKNNNVPANDPDDTAANTNVAVNTNGTTDTDVDNTHVLVQPKDIEVPSEINLAVPFTSQAPHANWELPYQEACEEASILMAARFLQGRSIAGADDANQAIVELVNYNVEELGQPIDTTIEETAALLEAVYPDLKTDVIYDWTWDDVKQALAQGYPVVFPAAGRELSNPYFTSPGPLYHMLVIKGYTESVVITNDPGTRRGADYQYSYERLFSANHDWNDGDVSNGAKVIMIVRPR